MAKLTVLSSSSDGNSYLLSCGEDSLLLDLGVDFKKVLKAVDYDIRKIRGCLCSHIHADHTKHLPDALKYQLKVYSCKSVAEKFDGVNILKIGHKYRIGSFYVQTLPVPHGDCECYAYIIDHEDIGRLLFATDLSDFPYKVKDCNHIMLECNNSLDMIVDNMVEGHFNRAASNTHLDMDNCFEILRRLETPNLQSIILLHLSDWNSNENTIRERLSEEFPVIDYHIADKGLTVELSKTEF